MFCHPRLIPYGRGATHILGYCIARVAASGFPQQRMGPVMLVVKNTNELLQQEDVS